MVNLQVPLSKDLREKATKAASEEGFSSLQEFIRVMLTKLAKDEINLRLQPSVRLSAKNEKRYTKMDEDFKAGRNVKEFDSVEDFLADLNL